MKITRLKELLAQGHEFEFEYKGKRYGLTWSEAKDGVLGFYEFNKEDAILSKEIDEILSATYNDLRVSEIIEDLKEEDMDIF